MTTLQNSPLKKKQNPERDLVLKPLMSRLAKDPDIIFWYRTASFQIGTLRIGCPGVPDLVAVVDCHNGKVALWFLECKAPDSPIKEVFQLPYEQKMFVQNLQGRPMTGISIISDPKMYLSEKRKVQAL